MPPRTSSSGAPASTTCPPSITNHHHHHHHVGPGTDGDGVDAMGHRNHRALVKLVPQKPLHSGVHLLVEAVVVSSSSTPPRAIDSYAAARGTATPSSYPRQAHGHYFHSY
ncbi:hypothetical protein MY4824_002929 [Beauveria thailandica]